MKYLVTRKEVWNSVVAVEADNREEALSLAANMEGHEIDNLFEYNHTLDTDVWDVEQISDPIFDDLVCK